MTSQGFATGTVSVNCDDPTTEMSSGEPTGTLQTLTTTAGAEFRILNPDCVFAPEGWCTESPFSVE